MVSSSHLQSVKLFGANSAKHLLQKLKIKKGDFSCKAFSDGELFLKLNEEVNQKEVWVLASTHAPAENILELIFLLDTLKRSGAKIKLILTYFGYARQDKPKHNEASSGELLSKRLQSEHLAKVFVLHMHSERLRHALTYEKLIPYDLYTSIAERFDAIVAPDKGAIAFAKELAKRAKKPLILIEKKRPSHERVKIVSISGDVKDKRLLIVDDMISTGNTLIEASKLLKKKGAKYIEAMATHGVFAPGALERLKKSSIRKITVTNSLPQKKAKNLKVLNIAPLLEEVMKKGY